MKTRVLCTGVFTLIAFSGLDLRAQDQTGIPASDFVRSSQIVGMEVHTSQHENLGRIDEVVFDKNRGNVAYVIVAPAAADAGGKVVAVPWEALKKGDQKMFTVDVTTEKWAKAPSFDKNSWPNFAEARWTDEVRTFYGTTAMDRTRGDYARTDANRDRMDGNRDRDMNRDRPINGDRDNARDRQTDMKRDSMRESDQGTKQTVTYNGTIKTFTRSDPASLVVATDRGDLYADLGPTAFIDEQKLTFDPGNRVTIRGYETTRDGRRTFIATEYTTPDGRTIQFRRDGATAYRTDRTAETTDRRVVDQSGVEEITGTVSYVESGECQESSYGRLAYVKTDRGDQIVVLGPGYYLDRQNWHLRTRDPISVKGYYEDRAGRRYFTATEVRRGQDTWALRNADGTWAWSAR